MEALGGDLPPQQPLPPMSSFRGGGQPSPAPDILTKASLQAVRIFPTTSIKFNIHCYFYLHLIYIFL